MEFVYSECTDVSARDVVYTEQINPVGRYNLYCASDIRYEHSVTSHVDTIIIMIMITALADSALIDGCVTAAGD